MVEYPVKFEAEVENEAGENLRLEASENFKEEITAPEEFGGLNSSPSPETLYAASLVSCTVATFKKIASRKNLEYESIEADSETVLDRGEDSRPIMKSASIKVEVKNVSDREKASNIASATEKNCFIHNSVDTNVETEFSFS